MPRYGFSGKAPDMKKLLLHIMRHMGEPVSERELTSLSLLDDNADYFLFSDALAGLTENGMLIRRDGTLELTPRGEEIAAVVERGLPAALRRAVAEECVLVRDRQMRARRVSAEVEEEGGAVFFRGVLTDGELPLLSLRLQTGGEKQAAALKKAFEKNAETIMERVWEVLTL